MAVTWYLPIRRSQSGRLPRSPRVLIEHAVAVQMVPAINEHVCPALPHSVNHVPAPAVVRKNSSIRHELGKTINGGHGESVAGFIARIVMSQTNPQGGEDDG